MDYTSIIIKKKEHIGIITINRPKALNALNQQTIKELTHALGELEEDKTIRAAIITGEGKAFIAGADIKQMKDMTPLEAKEFSETGHRLLQNIEESKIPFIAAVNGFALGGGCEVMMACDICIVAKSAKIGQPEINLGICPGFGGTQRLPRIVGLMKAKELLLTGGTISADEAKAIGLVNMVIDDEKLMDEAEKLAGQIASKSPVQISFIKALVNKGINIDLNNACALETSFFSTSFSSYDQKEGMNAFLEKRKPSFKGK